MGYWAVIQKEKDWYYAHFPDIPDCEVRSKTIEEIKVLLQETLNGHLQLFQKINLSNPKEEFNPTVKTTHPKKIPLNVVEYVYIKSS